MQSARTGSFDLRNLSKVVAAEGDKGRLQAISTVTSLLAGSIRGTLKKSVGFNYGESQKGFFKDLGHTISEALKGAKVQVDLSGVGKVEKEDHGGHGGGHGGGHH